MTAARNKCDIPPRLAIITNISYMPNLGFLSNPHSLEEAYVVQPGHGHLGEVGWPHHLICHVQKSLQVQLRVSISSPWPRRGICGPPTWSWCILTDPKKSLMRAFSSVPSTNSPSFRQLGSAISKSISFGQQDYSLVSTTPRLALLTLGLMAEGKRLWFNFPSFPPLYQHTMRDGRKI